MFLGDGSIRIITVSLCLIVHAMYFSTWLLSVARTYTCSRNEHSSVAEILLHSHFMDDIISDAVSLKFDDFFFFFALSMNYRPHAERLDKPLRDV